MVIRELPKEEYHRLGEFLSDYSLPHPDYSAIVVAEDEGDIVGYWVTVQVVHAEPIWIHPNYRKGSLVSRMWTQVREMLAVNLIKCVFCFSDRSDTADYLQRLGFAKLPYEVFKYEE